MKELAQYPYVQAFKLQDTQDLHGAALYIPQPAFLSLLLPSQLDQAPSIPVPGPEGETAVIESIYTVTEEGPIRQEQEPMEEQRQPSRYHDDLMPFSFLWWLHKTRIEYSDTYQPYASHAAHNLARKQQRDPDWIDQQIKENIFHLQSPEVLLSEVEAKKTIAFEIPKNENPVIEKFIKEEPQIKPPSPAKINLENKARKSAEDNSGFVSETLAKIYTEQGLYSKAIDTYKKLSLKFPEKSPYFAKLIKELNNKIT